jgi:hypothetical protein
MYLWRQCVQVLDQVLLTAGGHLPHHAVTRLRALRTLLSLKEQC